MMIDGFAGDGGSESAVSIGINNEFVLQDQDPIIYQKAAIPSSNFNPVSNSWWGGTKYNVPQGIAYPVWGGNYDGSGEYTISAGQNGPVAEVLAAGGSVVILGQTAANEFQVVTAASDTAALAATPPGKIGLYFVSGVGYRQVNNTGAVANIYLKEKRTGPSE